MLKLENITKVYGENDNAVEALKCVSMQFRKSEFVAILGSSGCGKTTLLNIIGGLDRYTSGDLLVAGRSTKDFKDGDWDAYRNNSIGFIFQSYNLIGHQTVLANVEMALTLAGVSAKERKLRAENALKKVGLADKLKKLPNQLSGGQMQRVAIARALINDPEIILADEPTGALDSETSKQVMDLLKAVSKDRLVIMVTHNGELAKEYATRIVKLHDGEVVADSAPLLDQEKAQLEVEYKERRTATEGKSKRTAMGFGTAFMLSLKNLLTKKGRTFLTAFAGSIGIIGVALVLAFSSGVSGYITRLQKDTLATYPLTIAASGMDEKAMISAMTSMQNATKDKIKYPGGNEVWINDVMTKMMKDMQRKNDIKNAKKVIEEKVDKSLYYTVDENYSAAINIYTPLKIASTTMYYKSGDSALSALVGSDELLDSQYDVLYGAWPKTEIYTDENGTKVAEAVVAVDQYNQITDMSAIMLWGNTLGTKFTFEDLVAKEFKAISAEAYFTEKTDAAGVYDRHATKIKLSGTELDGFGSNFYETTEAVWSNSLNVKLKISGIVRLNKSTELGAITTTMAYSSALTKYMLEDAANSSVVKEQLKNDEKLVVSDGNSFDKNYTKDYALMTLGYQAVPNQLSIYARDFKSKELIKDAFNEYNNSLPSADDSKYIGYSDLMEAMMGMLTKFIDIVTYALVGFTAISLVVSSIMIGIITYISVLERTKEIGILRAIGARKRDVSSVFNAETVLIGLIAGVIGIVITLVLAVVLNVILAPLTGIATLVIVKWWHSLLLIGISILLTLIAGIIPSAIASKRDPVTALRTE